MSVNLTIKQKPLRGVTEKQKQVLKKMAVREHPVSPAVLGCSVGLCERLVAMGLAMRELNSQQYHITNNGKVLLSMCK